MVDSRTPSTGSAPPASSAPSPTEPARATASRYRERLSAPVSWWLAVVLVLGLSGGLIFLKFSPVQALVGLVVGVAIGVAGLLWYGAASIVVSEGELAVPRARIPLAALGAVTVLDREAAFRLRTVDADPRAFMVLRGYVATAVRVEVTDPGDPTPYLYLSTRRPARLAAALQK